MTRGYNDMQSREGYENSRHDYAEGDELEGYDYTRDPEAFDDPDDDYYVFPDDELRRRRNLEDDDYPLPHEIPRGVWADEDDDEEEPPLRRVA